MARLPLLPQNLDLKVGDAAAIKRGLAAVRDVKMGGHLTRWLAIGDACLRISKQVNEEMGNPNAPVTGKRGGAVNIAFSAKLAAYPELEKLDSDLRTAAMRCVEQWHITTTVLERLSPYHLQGGMGIEGVWRQVFAAMNPKLPPKVTPPKPPAPLDRLVDDLRSLFGLRVAFGTDQNTYTVQSLEDALAFLAMLSRDEGLMAYVKQRRDAADDLEASFTDVPEPTEAPPEEEKPAPRKRRPYRQRVKPADGGGDQ
jgi:hypothetical protein